MSNRSNGYSHNAHTPANVEQAERSAPVTAIVDQNGQPYEREQEPATNIPARRSSAGGTSPRDRGRPRPLDEVRVGLVKAAVWQNEHETDDGRSFIRYGVTLEKIYLDGSGKWRSTKSFGPDDLLALAEVARKARDRIDEYKLERPL